ncbi:FecR family protein [Flagellimonas pacifica]|uniref:FecR family protein n=1 Tax=Flagellimonas pacifica TaxID=1247520 RepID=A0A285MWW3_9FLAO|nr:FecR family protein [Allomuricauda parva]SNZ01664.1 FecR family protein [Allomuricauda parva]
MQEQEFKKLLDKYLNGSISDHELEILVKFKEELRLANKESHFTNEDHKNAIKESLWTSINTQTRTSKKKKSLVWKVSAAAAVFIGLLATGYFYLQNTKSNTDFMIPENVITLQLENGEMKIIDEDGQVEIFDDRGNIIGQQEGKSLKYANTIAKKELVYNTLNVPNGKTFQLRLSDGTIAHLNAGSSIKYPVQFIKGTNRQIFVTGETYLDVAKDPEHPFIVNTNGLNVQVLGTQFNVSAYPEDETTEVVLVEGSVSLYTETEGYDANKRVYLEPGFKGSFDKTKNNIDTSKVITGLYTSWINGKLVFRNMTFNNILKKLERHYNVTITNNNSDLTHEEFNANFGNEPIENVLRELKSNYGIEYKILGDKIIIE